MDNLQGLRHEPYGLEHPYEQAPFERFPRDPLHGQPVALGLSTWPPGAAQAVWATWQVEGQAGEAAGRWLEDAQEQSHWRVQLPAFCRGQRVRYRLHACQGERELRSETFSFVVAGWQLVGDVVAYQVRPEGLALECVGDGFNSHLGIVFSPDWLCLQLAANSGAPPARLLSKSACRLVQETAERLVVAAHDLRLVVQRRPCRLAVLRADGTPLLQEVEPLAWLVGEGGRALRVRQSFASPPDEAFYGFGERFNALNQRGNTLDTQVFEQYKAQGRRTYIPSPFFISSAGYGQFADTCRNIVYDLAASRPDRWSFDAEMGPEESLALYVIVGRPKHVVKTLTDLTAKPALPPRWAFGPWMSSNEWNSQARVMEVVRQTLAHRIPATVLVIEAWSDEATFYIWNDAQYTPKPSDEAFVYDDFAFPPDGRWPDPKGMIEELHRLGMRVVLWQIPVLKKLDAPHPQHDRDTAHMVEKGYCVREAGGQPYRIRPFWFHDGLLMDFTHPEGAQWWLEKRAYLLDELGVDGFKTDGGEHLWGAETRFSDGRRGDELLNLYPNLYVGAYYGFAQAKRQGDALTFSRAGFAGAQAFPCHWAGDENSTWAAFRASLLAGLNAGLSGLPFWGWDLAGFSKEIPSAELYMQSAAMAAFCPIMQYHSEFNHHRQPLRDRTPWNIAARTGNPDVIPVYRFYANLRMNLLPYVYSEAQHSAQTGLPLMRAMWLEYPDDPACRDLDEQYLFGRSLLVAPLLAPGLRQRRLYLPPGNWYDFWEGGVYGGGRWIDYDVPPGRLPVFVREGAVLPLHTGQGYALGSPLEAGPCQELTFRLYPGTSHATSHWYDEQTAQVRTFTLDARSQGGLQIQVPPLAQAGTLLVPDAGFREVTCEGDPLSRVESLESLAAGAWYGEEGEWVYVRLSAAAVSRRLRVVLEND